MTAARPTIRWCRCPKCQEEGAAIVVRLPAARQRAAFFLCDCSDDVGHVQIEGEKGLRPPHESLVKAVRDFRNGNVPVCLEGHPEKSFDDIEELLAAYSDFTQPPAGAVRSRHERKGAASDELADVTEPEPSEAETDEEQRDEEDDPLLFDPATFRPQDESERAKFKAAFAYIERGYPITLLHGVEGDTCTCHRGVACSSPGKHPVGTRWTKRAIRSKEALAKRWHVRNGQATNIGILLRDDDRFFVVDEDNKNGKAGAQTLREWEQKLEISFDDYLVQVTPSGGGHYAFRVPSEFPVESLPNGAVAPGVDVLRDGRQFVLSPSTTPIGRYHRPGLEGDVVLPPLTKVPEAPKVLLEHLASLAGDRGRKNKGPVDLEALKAPSVDLVREVVRRTPNGEDATYDDYINMAHAIKGACGPEHEEDAREIFYKWAECWEGGVNTPETNEEKFDSISYRTLRSGWHNLFNLAAKLGCDDDVLHAARVAEAQEEFDADPSLAPEAIAHSGPITEVLRSSELSKIDAAAWDHLPVILSNARIAASSLGPSDQRLLRVIALAKLQQKTRSYPVAQALLRIYWPDESSRHDPFTYGDGGVFRLQTLREQDIGLDTGYVVDGLIPSGAVGALIADYSLGKTWLAIDLGLSVAFGATWFRRQTQAQPVIFVIAEGNQSFPKRLFGWLYEHRYLPKQTRVSRLLEALDRRALISRYPLQFDHPQFEAGLVATIQQTNAALVIFDTLGKLLGAEQSENDNDTANAITGMLSRIAAKTGCTCIFTHHTGYQDQTRGRGASALTQGLDFAYRISGTRDDLKDGRPVRLVPIKFRDDRWPEFQRFRLKSLSDLVLVRPNGEPVPISSGVIEEVEDHGLPPAGTVDLKAYTTAIERGENTQALHLALSVLLGLEETNGAIADTPRVSRKDFLTNYNGHLEDMAQRAQVDAPKLKDTYAKALLAQLCGHTPPLVRKDGKGRATGYLATEVGRQMAAKTVDEFDRWWQEHVRTDNADARADEEDS